MEIRAGFRPLQCLAPGFLPLEWRHSSNCVNYLWELREHDLECEMSYVPWHWQQWTLLLSCLLRHLHGWSSRFCKFFSAAITERTLLIVLIAKLYFRSTFFFFTKWSRTCLALIVNWLNKKLHKTFYDIWVIKNCLTEEDVNAISEFALWKEKHASLWIKYSDSEHFIY